MGREPPLPRNGLAGALPELAQLDGRASGKSRMSLARVHPSLTGGQMTLKFFLCDDSGVAETFRTP
ncbi:MAG: hypothetical protein NVS3B26_17690 [Mycobacteriales bacterium]